MVANVATAPTAVEPKIVSVPMHGVTPVGPPMNLTPTIMVPTGHPTHVPAGAAMPISAAQPIPISIPTQPVQMQVIFASHGHFFVHLIVFNFTNILSVAIKIVYP